MFRQSRKKIIISIMGAVILLFALTMGVILLTSYRDLRKRDLDLLNQYAASYRLGQKTGPEDRPGEEREPNGRKGGLSDWGQLPLEARGTTYYSAAFSREDGSVLKIDNDGRIYSDEEVVELAQQMLAMQGRQKVKGQLGTLRFLVMSVTEHDSSSYDLVVFLDSTPTANSLKTMLHNGLIVGGAAIVVLFFLSFWLAKRIIRPLEENDRQQRQFISDASHELKTPVAVIDANAELLAREVGENEWLSNIRYENDRMGGLVTQLLDLSRAESAELPEESVDLSRLVTGEELAFESLAFDQGKRIRSEVGEDIHVTGSETQLAQLVSVLLDNAVRHSTGEEIALSLKKQGHSAVLTVENDGEAIPEEKAAHLFDRFYRIDEARSGDGQHYGLGLSIAKAVAEKHGGSIGAECADGKVTFTVTLPAKK